VADLTAIVAASLVSAATAVTMSALGVEPQQLVIATVGAGAGSVAAPNLGRVRAILTFVCVVCLCAVVGALVAEVYIGPSKLARNSTIGVLAALFHPLFSFIVAWVQDLFNAAARKWGFK
jgi:hypothetical protein